jgi:hypothetical protein
VRFPYLAPGRGLPTQTERAQILEQANLRGSNKPLDPLREVTAQAAPRGLLVNFALPAGDSSAINGYRVYVGDETNLQQTVRDRGTRQVVVPVTAGAAQTVLISSVDARGNESPKVPVQGTALAEAGAPAMPAPPVDFNKGSGADQSSGNNRLNRT